MRFFFILFGHVKDRINSNGRQNGIFGWFTLICTLTDSRSSIEETKITFPRTTLNPLVPLPIPKWILSWGKKSSLLRSF